MNLPAPELKNIYTWLRLNLHNSKISLPTLFPLTVLNRVYPEIAYSVRRFLFMIFQQDSRIPIISWVSSNTNASIKTNSYTCTHTSILTLNNTHTHKTRTDTQAHAHKYIKGAHTCSEVVCVVTFQSNGSRLESWTGQPPQSQPTCSSSLWGWSLTGYLAKAGIWLLFMYQW